MSELFQYAIFGSAMLLAGILAGASMMLMYWLWLEHVRGEAKAEARAEFYQGRKPQVSKDADAEIEELIFREVLGLDPCGRKIVDNSFREVTFSFSPDGLPDTCSIAKRILAARSAD